MTATPPVPRPLYVATEAISAAVRTGDQLIVGQVHVHPGKRLKDELNLNSDRYVAVTGARVYDGGGQRLLYKASCVLVASDHVVSVTPLASVDPDGGDWQGLLKG
ncbi:MAG TPA: hypothetical protein VFM29_00065 [Vicinamibacteria bacterium]|nr:hypothetical protein [Vicinamibacteria bacterium]